MPWTNFGATLTTPMLCNLGKDPSDDEGKRVLGDTFRIPELRSQMRSWLRISLLPHTSPASVRRIEAELFGDASGRPNGQQSPIRLRFDAEPNLPRATRFGAYEQHITDRGYLAGPGFTPIRPADGDRNDQRRWTFPMAVTAPELFRLRIDAARYGPIAADLLWLSAIGGIGARRRRCFGGFRIKDDDLRLIAEDAAWEPPDFSLPLTWADRWDLMLDGRPDTHSAAEHAGILKSEVSRWESGAANGFLDEVARRWRAVRAPESQNGKRKSRAYINTMYDVLGGHAPHENADLSAAALGLPVIYRSSTRAGIATLVPTDFERRASPIILRPLYENGIYHLLVYWFEGPLLPDSATLKIKSGASFRMQTPGSGVINTTLRDAANELIAQ